MLSSIVVGGGPGGLGPLIWAAQNGLLQSWLDQGIAIVDRQEHLGGTLGNYGINSDSLGGSYLEHLDAPGLPEELRRLRDDPVTREMRRYQDGFPPLPLVDRFMRRLGVAIEAMLADRPASTFHRCTSARCLQLRPDGSVTVDTVRADGRRVVLHARSAVVALGGRQDWAEQTLLPDLAIADCRARRMMPSDRLLSRAGLDEAARIVDAADGRRIVVLGGSHSAYAAAWALLRLPSSEKLGAGQIAIVERRAPRVFYPGREEAEADLYPIVVGDVCPRTHRVNRLGGLRGNGRDIWRQITRRPDTVAEPRVVTLPLQQFSTAALRGLLEDAAVVVPAFGYRAAMLPVFDAHGRQLDLCADANLPAVDDDCRVRLAGGGALSNVFSIGLGSGYRPSGSMGGEPNFDGQANSLWLYQNDIGAVIYRGIQELAGETPAETRLLQSAAAA